MRRLLSLTMLIALILGGLWLGGETLLARRLSQIAMRDPAIAIGAVSELREWGRIGVHIADLHIDRPSSRLELPGADLWIAPTAPTEARLDLPPQALVDAGAGPMALGLEAADARIRLRPLAGMTLESAALRSGTMTLEGVPLARDLRLNAESAPPGPDAPYGTAAAYDLAAGIDRLDPARLGPEWTLPGPVHLTAQGRLWLDRAPGPGRLAPETRPAILGLRIDRADLSLGPFDARIMGHVEADPQGRAQGRLLLYTANAEPLLQAAADAGWFPANAVKLAGQMLETLGELPIPQAPASDNRAMSFPDPAKDELRLPLILSEGRMRLGPVPLGPAPFFPR